MNNLEVLNIGDLNGGEVFSIKWVDSAKETTNIVLQVDTEQYFLIELGKGEYWTRYETLVEELQSEEEILEYLEFIDESEQASVAYLGNLNEKDNKKELAAVSLEAHDLLTAVENSYETLKDVHSFPIRTDSVMQVHSGEGKLLGEERLTIVGDSYFLLPANRKVEITEEEAMTEEELFEYMYALVAEEGSFLTWGPDLSEMNLTTDLTFSIKLETEDVG